MFDGIKNKLGFQSDSDDYYDDEFDDEYDAYSDNFDDFSTYDEDEEGYSPYSPVTTRDPAVKPLRSSYSDRGDYASRRRPTAHPPLVSYEEVRASTSVPDSLSRDPLPSRRSAMAPRSLAGHASDYAYSGTLDAEGYDEPYAAQNQPPRQSGYDSLFTPTTGQSNQASVAQPASEVGVSVHTPVSSQVRETDAYDPYRAYEGEGMASHRPTRNVVVLSPTSYDEVADVARTLKAGDVVVLSLRNTNSQLSKRILDFSFGVASALDASVDCIADKVFAVARGDQLSDSERMRLRAQGVI